MQADLDRFLALVRRELGADDVRVLEAEQQGGSDPYELQCRMADGRGVGARFLVTPADREAKQRRLEMLVSTFDGVVQEASQPRRSRPPVELCLRDELSALSARARALNSIVIDANSPVEWGAARPQQAIPLEPRTPETQEEGDESSKGDPEARSRRAARRSAVASRRALHAVRALPELAELRRGKHLRHVDRTGETPLIAHSFAGIYVLVVVFGAPFDELRAERAIFEALPRIERLVLALPPLDPAPNKGVMALRRPRRR